MSARQAVQRPPWQAGKIRRGPPSRASAEMAQGRDGGVAAADGDAGDAHADADDANATDDANANA